MSRPPTGDGHRTLPQAGAEAPRVIGMAYPTWHPDEIAPRLFMGGTSDSDTVFDPGSPTGIGQGQRAFDAVVTLYAWAQPVSWEVEELRYGFGDGALEGADTPRLIRTAAWAHQRWRDGDRVLVRCQAGLNRSGLITALVLMLDGVAATDAIATIRQRRSPHALFNPVFVHWLTSTAPGQLGIDHSSGSPR